MRFGPLEIGIIAAVIVLLFGVGRISKIFGELGTGIRSFKDGLQGDTKEDEEEKSKDEN